MSIEEFVFITLIVCLFIYLYRKKQGIINIPGPKSIPLLGNVLQMAGNKNLRTDQILEHWARQYGGVYSIKVFNTPWLIVNGYDELYEMMVTKSKAFSGRYVWFRIGYAIFGNKDIVLGNPTQPQWMPMKKAAHRAIQLRGNNLNRIETILVEVVQEFIENVKKYDGLAVDYQSDIYDFVSKVVLSLTTGNKIDDDENLEKFKQLEHLFIECASPISGVELDHFPWLRYFGHPIWKKMQNMAFLRDNLWEKLWTQSKESYLSDKEASCTMHTIAQMMDPSSPFYEPTIDIENAKALFFDMVIGGIATTSNTIYTLLNLLLHHPTVYEKLQLENDAVIGRHRPPGIFDRESMPYTNATIFEVLRLHSLLPVSFRQSLEDATIGKYFIPAGTVVMGLLCAMHHDEKFWGDPWEFRPERFMDRNGQLIPPDHPNRKHLMPFGNGSRVCVGEIFALRRLFIFITSVVQTFDLQPGNKIVSCHPADYANGTFVCQKPFTARLIARK